MSFFSVSNAAHHGNASPSISLERGTHRMRAPITRPPPLLLETLEEKKKPQRKPIEYRANRNLALLVALLIIGCVTCFGTAWYLYTTRWDSRPTKPFRDLADDWTYQVIDTHTLRTRKYLSYLPHSGFHNQRIAFENALLLSYVLNRTLIVPPIRLGTKPIRYVEYNTLSRYLELSGKEGLEHCRRVPPHMSLPLECLQYFESSNVPWSWIFNASRLAVHQPLLHAPNLSPSWIRTRLQLSSADIYELKDVSPYHFRFLDTLDDTPPPSNRYQEDIYINHLASVEARLLQIGTLFGTSRLRLRDKENIAYLENVRRSLVINNPTLEMVADRISRRLSDSYLGLHLRTGDGKFKKNVDAIVKAAWLKVVRDVLGFRLTDICDLERYLDLETSTACLGEMVSGDDGPSPSDVFLSPTYTSSYTGSCTSARHSAQRYHALNIPLYIATDMDAPEDNPLLHILRKTFPCHFVLGDFKEIAPLKNLESPLDGVNLYTFSLPFVDAVVLGKARNVVGTEGSTFSKYVEGVLWPSFGNFSV
ncbi:hypothetical protein CPC08DRAFT_787345 [Agrocybe pediades]|nr:hypothetical protein CPC08DRAFT_787345 [Agrocybe pediades]